jgi:hypothetical protein
LGTVSKMLPSHSRHIQELKGVEEVDVVLKDLQINSEAWKEMPIRKKIALLQAVRGRALKASVELGIETAKVRTALSLLVCTSTFFMELGTALFSKLLAIDLRLRRVS